MNGSSAGGTLVVLGPLRSGLVAGLAGAAVMTLELTAVRLLAPYFGDSSYVWTNVIGVILVALAGGAWIGGRLAAGTSEGGSRRLSLALAIAAALIALVPPLGGWLGPELLPQDLPLDAAMPAMVWGSLTATLILFAPPVFLLGMVTPMLIALRASEVSVGRAAGAIGAIGTLGSLMGTFASTHVLVPGLGVRWTVWLAAGVLAICALILFRSWVGGAAAALPLLLGVLIGGPLRAAPDGYELLAERESRYQFLQVLRDNEGTTVLKINEGLDSFHSVALKDTVFTGGRYYDSFAAVPYLAGDGEVPEDLRVLSLGDAAGTFSRLFGTCFPECAVDAVEIDPDTTELGHQFFGGYPDAVRAYSADARFYVNVATDRTYHVVLVDAYEHQIYIPAHVASREFFGAVHERLVDGGIVAINVGGRGPEDELVSRLEATMRAEFEDVWVYVVPQTRNLLIAARRARPMNPPLTLEGIAESGNGELDALLATVANTDAWMRLADTGAEVLVDDRPVLDSLWEEAFSAGELLEMRGAKTAEETEAAALESVQARDGAAALAVLRQGPETPQTRYWAGIARWLDRDPLGAHGEFDRALALDPPAEFREFVEAKQAELGRGKALEIGSRNGWLALAVAGMLLFATLVVAHRSRAT